MKKRLVVFAMLLTLVVTMLAPLHTAEAAAKVKAPTISAELNDDNVPVISWKKVSGVTGYRVYRKTETDTKWVRVKTTSKTSVTDTACKAEDGTTVKYTVKSYIKVDGKITWSSNAKAASVKMPSSLEFTYGIEGNNYCTYLDGKMVVKDYYPIPEEYLSANPTLEELQDGNSIAYSTYYYYDDKYLYEYSGASYMIYVYDVVSKKEPKGVGVFEEFSFSPNHADGTNYKPYEETLDIFNEFQKKFLAGELESVY